MPELTHERLLEVLDYDPATAYAEAARRYFGEFARIVGSAPTDKEHDNGQEAEAQGRPQGRRVLSVDVASLLHQPWRLAWVIAEGFRGPAQPSCSFEEFAEIAERWVKRTEPGAERFGQVPGPAIRDGIRAEMAVRDYLRAGGY